MGKLTVADCMTSHPYWINEEASLREAMSLMTERRIRHLPVKRGKAVVGVLSDRDLRMVFGMAWVKLDETQVKVFCQTHPFAVDPQTPLAEVARQMAAEHYGSAVVMKANELVGIFTTVDACRVLADFAEGKSPAS